MAGRKQHKGALAGLCALLVALVLLDAGFVNWRDDGYNFPNADGVILPRDRADPPPGPFQNTRDERVLGWTGAAFLVLSIVLVAKDPL